jgi:N utilization substance protein A
MNVEFIQALDDIEKDKGISKDVLLEAIETALVLRIMFELKSQ